MDERNNEKRLESKFSEAVIIEVGGRNPGGKRGKSSGIKHQYMLMVLSSRRLQQYPRLMEHNVQECCHGRDDCKVTTDDDTCFI